MQRRALLRSAGCLPLLTLAKPLGAKAAAPTQARFAFISAVNSLDPVMEIEALPIFRSIFDTLTDTAPDGTLIPRLARSWTVSEDARTITFVLRDNASWSDGTRVTAEDVAYTVAAILSQPRSLNHNYIVAIDHVSCANPYEVTFFLKTPFAAWPRQMSLISIVPKHVHSTMSSAAFSASPMGSGPYRVTGWNPSATIELNIHAGYWGQVPEIERVTIVPLADSVARLNGLLSGDLDVIPLAPQQVTLARQQSDISVETVLSNRVAYIGFNTTNPMLSDLRLRQAIDCAIDRNAITRYLLGGLAQPTGNLVASATFGYDPDLAATPYDLARAKRLIGEAEYDGTTIALNYATDGALPLGSEVAQAISGFLEDAGFRIALHGMDWRSLVATWITRKFTGLYIFSYGPSTMDASLVFGSLIGPNGSRYFTDPQIDRLEDAQHREADPSRRLEILHQILRRSNEQVYYAPLFNDDYPFAVRQSAVRFTPRADGYIHAQDLRLAQA